MVTGHLREQNGMFQMILTWKDDAGRRRTKSISTGLPVKGNKKRAEKMLLKARSEFNPGDCPPTKGMPFTNFLKSGWMTRPVTFRLTSMQIIPTMSGQALHHTFLRTMSKLQKYRMKS